MTTTERASVPDWYKDAIIYEVRTRSFYDSDGDGIGDFQGLTAKLDYLQDLGVDTLWLLPFYPSPLRDDGYDISDYTDVHPDVGTLRDFKTFLKEAHRRGLRVVTELVLNHTSDQHRWFQLARRAKPGSRKRDFYVWSDTPDRFADARVIFKDFESSNWTWDPVAGAYYWHRFYGHQPDLNFDNSQVRKSLLQIVDFWFGMGVDGLRLDAIPYLYQREGTNCENLPEVHGFLKELRAHVDRRHPNRMLLAEANQWPEDAAAYFGEGDGDECHMAFHFPIMPRLFMALQMEDHFPIADILQQTPSIPTTSQWALFLRNHDELTLEMVTDEERDYMYRMYAANRSARINLGIRRRLAPLLGNDRKKIELMNALLFSMPGTPVLYYGDEIGMGDNFYLGDRNGVRTPMQWNGDRNAGFSRANPQELFLPCVIDPEYHYEMVNVETQQNNPHSMLWWMKRLIALRRDYSAFGRGSLEILESENHRVFAFFREHGEERILVVCNLSRFPQSVELDLSRWQDMTPVELFGGSEFPPIRRRPYFMTLGPHTFFWFALERLRAEAPELPSGETVLSVEQSWQEVLEGAARKALERRLPDYVRAQRWFGGKARRINSVALGDTLRTPGHDSVLAILHVVYADGSSESYLLPLAFATGLQAERLAVNSPGALILKLRVARSASEGYLFDAAIDESFGRALLECISRRRRVRGRLGTLRTGRTRIFGGPYPPDGFEVRVGGLEQSNTTIRYGDRLMLKLFRRIQNDVSPDLEIGRALTERTSFANSPKVAGWIEYESARASRGSRREQPSTLGILHHFVGNVGDAWSFVLDDLGRFYERVLSRGASEEGSQPPPPPASLLGPVEAPESVSELLGAHLDWTRTLASRTAELHRALASLKDDPSFTPEPFSKLYQRAMYQSMRTLTGQVMRLLKQRLRRLPPEVRPEARQIAKREKQILERFRKVLERRVGGQRIRCHGDYHLGQVLFTGKDFVVLDFEGEPARPISERRIKKSPLGDVAGMLRSFHYAAYAALPGYTRQAVARSVDLPKLEPWARYWQAWTASTFVSAYLEAQEGSKLLPGSTPEVELLLDVLTLEKAVYELGYELNNRPEWLKIPLQAISQQLDATARTRSGTGGGARARKKAP